MASAAYRAGEKLHSEYYGEISDYTRKGGVICSEILLPSHAPSEYADRETLWNAVEKAERGKRAQLAYSFDIALQNEFYYDALRQSQTGWHDGQEDAIPFIKYLLGIVLSAYRDFEERFSLVEKKQSALEMVNQATLHKIGRFTKQDIRELCPSLSVSSVEGALRKLVASGELAREGSGKSTCYYRLK